jgi:ribose-phosphate pyrophosphokinase
MPAGRFGNLRVFSGTAHQPLAADICSYLEIPLGKADVFKFTNDNTFVRIL